LTPAINPSLRSSVKLLAGSSYAFTDSEIDRLFKNYDRLDAGNIVAVREKNVAMSALGDGGRPVRKIAEVCSRNE
jgi:hypothetical protein